MSLHYIFLAFDSRRSQSVGRYIAVLPTFCISRGCPESKGRSNSRCSPRVLRRGICAHGRCGSIAEILSALSKSIFTLVPGGPSDGCQTVAKMVQPRGFHLFFKRSSSPPTTILPSFQPNLRPVRLIRGSRGTDTAVLSRTFHCSRWPTHQ